MTERRFMAETGARMGARRAAAYLRDPAKTRRLLDAAVRKAEGSGREAVANLGGAFRSLVRLIGAYVSGRYTTIPWGSVLLATGAVIYFVMPVDLIPDFILGLGFVDDAAVIAWVLKAIGKDLDRFRAWEQSQADG